ncbi:Urea active transporter [Lachnellula subtilissima]|uniref:Urea active transporter n=1 Tax=Lachnellula subtilissima TaxID=602034 RepID=A0A8H8RZU6_9HELO|nr:Urea active transporter [Lachnellula subtilissima]
MPTDGILVLSNGVGYGIVVGIGAFFALLMLAITHLQNRYTSYSTHQAEEFNTASRSVKPGLIAAGIVSSWTWSATLLTSSTFAYTYGISGPMWYGAMGTWQILLFALIAIKIKSSAPGAHTFPEIVLARHGKIAHLTYLFYGWATNMLVGACLVLGGSQVVGALSGVNVYAACFLIPLVVAAYVIVGGLRSTFIADYTHTVILFLSIFVFGFSIYSTNPSVGSPSKFYDLLIKASANMPIDGNHEGSYLTFKSNGGLVFAIDLFVAGFSTVWLDQAYWQRAIASRPETSVKAYIFGGIAWYGIPFGFATAMGLGCAALTSADSFPTYPNALSPAQVGAGLSSPATAIALLGKGGAGLMLLLLFMAVTSSTSAELIAVSSLLTFDVYKTYIKRKATSIELVRVSHYGIILYALVLAGFCCILNAASINLTWLLTVLGIIPCFFLPGSAFFSGLIAWFVVTHLRSGIINVETTGDATNAVAGNITSWGTGLVTAVLLSFCFPRKFESMDEEHVARTNKINGVSGTGTATPVLPMGEKENTEAGADKEIQAIEPPDGVLPDTLVKTGNEVVDFLEASHIEPMDPAETKRATRLAVGFNILFLVVAILFVPFLLFGGEWIFSRKMFVGWCVVSFMWVWCSMVICVIWPVVESWGTIWRIARGVVGGGG